MPSPVLAIPKTLDGLGRKRLFSSLIKHGKILFLSHLIVFTPAFLLLGILLSNFMDFQDPMAGMFAGVLVNISYAAGILVTIFLVNTIELALLGSLFDLQFQGESSFSFARVFRRLRQNFASTFGLSLGFSLLFLLSILLLLAIRNALPTPRLQGLILLTVFPIFCMLTAYFVLSLIAKSIEGGTARGGMRRGFSLLIGKWAKATLGVMILVVPTIGVTLFVLYPVLATFFAQLTALGIPFLNLFSSLGVFGTSLVYAGILLAVIFTFWMCMGHWFFDLYRMELQDRESAANRLRIIQDSGETKIFYKSPHTSLLRAILYIGLTLAFLLIFGSRVGDLGAMIVVGAVVGYVILRYVLNRNQEEEWKSRWDRVEISILTIPTVSVYLLGIGFLVDFVLQGIQAQPGSATPVLIGLLWTLVIGLLFLPLRNLLRSAFFTLIIRSNKLLWWRGSTSYFRFLLGGKQILRSEQTRLYLKKEPWIQSSYRKSLTKMVFGTFYSDHEYEQLLEAVNGLTESFRYTLYLQSGDSTYLLCRIETDEDAERVYSLIQERLGLYPTYVLGEFIHEPEVSAL